MFTCEACRPFLKDIIMATLAKRLLTLAVVAGGLGLSNAQANDTTIETARAPATFSETPANIVVMDMAALDTIGLLGIKPIGVPDKLYVDYLQGYAEGAEAVGSLFEPNFEVINALQPDLVVIGGRSASKYEALSAFVPTIDMTIWGEDMVQQARARLEAYGALFNKREEAAKIEADFDATLEAGRAAVKDKGDALIVLANGPKVSAYGATGRFGWVHDALNIPEAMDDVQDATHGEAISFEFILNVNPDWLIVIDRSAAIGAKGVAAKETLDNALVQQTTAWKKGQVIYLDAANIYISGGGIQSMSNTIKELTASFEAAE